MKNKYIGILIITLFINLNIIVFYLSIDQITQFKNAKDNLSILISIIALFATFGGAYLGAKISGEANIKLEKQRQSEEYKKEAFTLKNKIVEYINKIEKNLCSLDEKYEAFVIELFNENEGNDLPFEEEEELLFF